MICLKNQLAPFSTRHRVAIYAIVYEIANEIKSLLLAARLEKKAYITNTRPKYCKKDVQ